ncbi:hypothetical protein GDO86_020100 [Hymenochirus boettgeri]|uniref:Complex I assembly factor TIMMDC1, mitochondrial n=1 Tax=Hymenochirus boettgeri TaxID=247094 RepID=A0A8T2IIF1_9PIPI|nr:hypothetical protein GDO86_020100 [Hymenochirus boettgeri]KAG8431753.1 hypothetical protein GDO86_020100 [Hymenochirus boettgeri]
MAQGASPENQEGPYQLPSTIQNPETPESGWDRIKELFKPNQLGQYPEEVQAVVKSTITGAILGWVYGGVPAARQSREHYIRQSQAEIYQHKVEAVRSAHNAALRGFIRYGWRWSWRVAAFVTVFNSVSTGLTVDQ